MANNANSIQFNSFQKSFEMTLNSNQPPITMSRSFRFSFHQLKSGIKRFADISIDSFVAPTGAWLSMNWDCHSIDSQRVDCKTETMDTCVCFRVAFVSKWPMCNIHPAKPTELIQDNETCAVCIKFFLKFFFLKPFIHRSIRDNFANINSWELPTRNILVASQT